MKRLILSAVLFMGMLGERASAFSTTDQIRPSYCTNHACVYTNYDFIITVEATSEESALRVQVTVIPTKNQSLRFGGALLHLEDQTGLLAACAVEKTPIPEKAHLNQHAIRFSFLVTSQCLKKSKFTFAYAQEGNDGTPGSPQFYWFYLSDFVKAK